jgi:putative ABC transport system ATP-binding protein
MLTGIQLKRGMTLIVITHENDIARSAPRHIRIRDGLRYEPNEERLDS